MSWRFVRHDLLDLADAGTIWVAGPCDAANAMFFCAGFPCDHSSFAPLAARFAEVGCLVGVGCMPEYDREEGCLRPEGYDLPQIGRCFGQAVAALLGQATAAPKVTLWCMIGASRPASSTRMWSGATNWSCLTCSPSIRRLRAHTSLAQTIKKREERPPFPNSLSGWCSPRTRAPPMQTKHTA